MTLPYQLIKLLGAPLLRMRYPGVHLHFDEEAQRVGISFNRAKRVNLLLLRWFPISWLDLYGGSVDNWAVLKHLDFTRLNVGETQFSDMELLRGKPLTSLELWDTPVATLEPIRGMPLEILQIGRTRITNFEALRSLPLNWLFMFDCECDDLSFLAGMDLEYFAFTVPPETESIEPLLAMARLQRISTSPRDSFTPDEFSLRFREKLTFTERADQMAASDRVPLVDEEMTKEQREIVIDHPDFGRLAWDDDVKWWTGQLVDGRESLELKISISGDPEDSPIDSSCVEILNAVRGRLKDYLDGAVNYVQKELPHWIDSKSKLSSKRLRKAMRVESIVIRPESGAEVWFIGPEDIEDSGHAIHAEVDAAGNVISFGLHG
jgi:hypothetical protein